MTEATTYAFTRDAMNRAHAERAAVFAAIFAALFGRKEAATHTGAAHA